jgi:hypothetical protein
MLSEFDELLREINWKIHRKDRKRIVPVNLLMELADIQKYVISLCELWGFSADELMEAVSIKTEALDIMYNMEHMEPVTGRRVVISDMDGTIADWATSFKQWLVETGKLDEDDMTPFSSLNQDVDLGVSYAVYVEWKTEFEESGQYRRLVPIEDGLQLLRRYKELGYFISVYTARPQSTFKRVWMDSFSWLRHYGLVPDLLTIGAEARIIHAIEHMEKGNEVILLEDNPELALRAANSGVRVILRAAKYNMGIRHENIIPVFKFDESANYFAGDKNVAQR